MESITTCSICYSKYSQNSHIPLVLTCGHTFCKECVLRVSKCPLCRKIITSTTTNLIIFQISCTTLGQCSHKLKKLFCPLCASALCISCVAEHNMHGVISLKDPSLQTSISDKLSNAFEKLNETNKILKNDLEKVFEVKNSLLFKEAKIYKKINKTFDKLLDCVNLRKQEIIDEVESLYKPLSSKLDTLLTELDCVIQNNLNEMDFIEEIRRFKIKKQIEKIRPFKVQYINQNLVSKISERTTKLPVFIVKINKIVEEIQNCGKLQLESFKSLFGFKIF